MFHHYANVLFCLFRFQHIVGHQHPTIWKLIKALKEEDAVVRNDICLALIGNPPKKRIRAVYMRLDRALRSLISDHRDNVINVQQLLRGVGHRIRWDAQRGN